MEKHEAEQAERRRQLDEWRAQRELEKKREAEAKSARKRGFPPPFVIRKPENHDFKPAESVFRNDGTASIFKSNAAPSPLRHNPIQTLDLYTRKSAYLQNQSRPVKRTQSLSSVKTKPDKDPLEQPLGNFVHPDSKAVHTTTASKSAISKKPTTSKTTSNDHPEPSIKTFLSADHLGSDVKLAAGSRWASLDTMFGSSSTSEVNEELKKSIPPGELNKAARVEIPENTPELLVIQSSTSIESICNVDTVLEKSRNAEALELEIEVIENAKEVVCEHVNGNFDSEFLGPQFRECPLSFYMRQPLTVRVVDPHSAAVVKDYKVVMPSIAIFTSADAIHCGEDGDIDLARAIFKIISVDGSKDNQKASNTILFSGAKTRWHSNPEATTPRFWITWANWEEEMGNPMGALTVCETAMGKFTDKQDIDSIYATVKTIFESIDNEAGEPMVDQETCEEQQISDHENLQEISEGVRFNATTDAATSSLIQTPRNERTWGTSQNSQHEDVVDDTPQPVFGNFAGKPLRGTPHPGQGGTVSLEHNDCSDTMGSADGHSESDDEEYISKKMPDHDNNDCDVFSSSTHNTPRNRRKSTVSRRKKEISKKVRVGVRVDGDSEETAGSRVTVLTPRKARQNERESLGVTEIITPVRRSRRLFDESMYAPTQAEAHEIMENLDKPYEINSNDSARDIDDKENEQSLYPASGLMKQAAGRQGEKISKLLENYGYAYAPNKMLDPVTLPKSGKKHK